MFKEAARAFTLAVRESASGIRTNPRVFIPVIVIANAFGTGVGLYVVTYKRYDVMVLVLGGIVAVLIGESAFLSRRRRQRKDFSDSL